jgi:hypothetical protein
VINAQLMINQLEVLIGQYEALKSRSQHDDLSDLKEESRVLAVQLQAALDRMTLPGSTYRLDADVQRTNPTHIRVVQLSGIAKALRDDLHGDWVFQVSELVHADTFSEMSAMASELLDKGFKDPAAVIAGTSLELHLRSLAAKSGVSTLGANGRPQKADTINAELKKASVYGLQQQKSVTAWLNLRNESAHGNYSAYDAKEVEQMMLGVEHFVANYTA